jgi:hypothetical protein
MADSNLNRDSDAGAAEELGEIVAKLITTSQYPRPGGPAGGRNRGRDLKAGRLGVTRKSSRWTYKKVELRAADDLRSKAKLVVEYLIVENHDVLDQQRCSNRRELFNDGSLLVGAKDSFTIHEIHYCTVTTCPHSPSSWRILARRTSVTKE